MINKQKHLSILMEFLSIKSVSTQDKYLTEMARTRNFLVDLFKQSGFQTKILKGVKHDVVFAQRIVDKNLPTVLVYGHYDVQPPEPLAEWDSPAFEPTIRNGKIFARGATDNKGQIMAQIMAVISVINKNNGNPPINFKFVIEGEEEIGSISIESLTKKYSKTLFKCDYLVVSDTDMPKSGQPSIDTSLRGLVYAEVLLEIGKHDLHSGQFGGIAENPAILAARIINRLKDENEKVLIPNFYKNVLSPTKQELLDYKKIKATDKTQMGEGHIYGIGGGEKEFSLNERRWSRPTLDINGIWGGYQDEGSKTIIPAKAGFKVSMRLVPNQIPDMIYNNFVNYVKSFIPNHVKAKFIRHADCLPYKAPTDHAVFTLMKKSLKKAFGKNPVFTGVGGSIGFVPIVANALGVPCLLVGLGLPDDNVHAPNEKFDLENFEKGIEAFDYFYSNLKDL
jgi:acetylornithine deacetylase/succinyl-diaminopimelate desuccinylase-like protein